MTNTSIFGEGFARNFSRLTPDEALLNFANEQGLDTQDPDEILHAILYSHPEQFQFHMLNNETGFKSVHSAQSVVGLHQPLSPGSMTLQGLLFS